MKSICSSIPLALTVLTILLAPVTHTDAQSSAFTYQGRLSAGSVPANGYFDLRFAVFNALSLGTQQGTALTNPATAVSNGLITVSLDFGSGVFTGQDRWLEIAVRTNNSGAFSVLAPRQILGRTPYSLVANAASNLLGSLPASQVGGQLANSQLASSSLLVMAGTGLSGGGNVPLGGAIALNNSGILSIAGNSDITASTVNGAVTLGDTGTSANTPGLLVKRDAAGNFGAGSLTLSSNLFLPTTLNGAGMIYSGTTPLLYSPGNAGLNFFAGLGAGNQTMSGNFNLGIGSLALDADTSGANNLAFGYGALSANTTGNENLASGVNAMNLNLNGSQNTIIGTAALIRSTNGSANSALGFETLFFNNSGSNNTAGGYQALFNSTGNANLALGYQAGYNLTTGSSNIHIGNPGFATDTNLIRIGTSQTQTFIAGTLNGNGAGLTNINPTNVNGVILGLLIDDGGSSAYEDFLGPARALSKGEPVSFDTLSLVKTNSGAAPGLGLYINGDTFGTVLGFVGSEALSEPYSYVVEVTAANSALVAHEQLGRRASLLFSRNGRATAFPGQVTACSISAYDGTSSRYTFRLEPVLASLALTSDYRIYQQTTVPNLIRSLYNSMTGSNLTQILSGSYDQREATIQFGENDLNYFNRLLEEEGIFYFYDSLDAIPTLTLGDSASAYSAAANPSLNYYGDAATGLPTTGEYIRSFQKSSSDSTRTTTLQSYDFKNPKLPLQSKVSGDEGNGEAFEMDQRGTSSDALDQRARHRVERQEVEHNTSYGTANAPDLRPGHYFTLNDQTGAGLSGNYLVTAVRHSAFRRQTNGHTSLYYGNTFEAIPATLPFRPALKTTKPTAQPCTAVVSGPSGEEIYTDKYGRIKVHFHWDRRGLVDETASAWIRVATPWAGKNWGMIFIPRVGQEVLVSFIEGDPDQPIITGGLYNGDKMPPYDLPANKTQSGIKTISSKGGAPSDFNQIRFEDKKGLEALDITAERNYSLQVNNDQAIRSEHDTTFFVGHDLNLSVGNNLVMNAPNGIGINTGNDPSAALSVNGTIKATSFSGDGSGLTGLPPGVALLTSTQTFSAPTTFSGPVMLNDFLQFGSEGFLNDHDLQFRNDGYHGIGWYGDLKPFGAVQVNGPVVYGFSGGALGSKNFSSTNLALSWTEAGKVGIGTVAPTAALEVAGDERVRGVLRAGTETGTSESPSPAGLVVRRINSTSAASNSVIALTKALSSNATIALVRDGTSAGFQIHYPASPGNLTIACMGIDSTGTPRNFYTTLSSPSTAGTVQIYSNALGVVHFECTFGITFNSAQHLTQVTLSRYGTDFYWSGTLTSTFNQ